MSVTVSNLTQGPGTLYTGAFGAAEPADSAVSSTPAASAWTDIGGTDGGSTLKVDMTYSELRCDQIVDVPGRRLTKRDTSIATNLAEPTLDNLAVALNGGTIDTQSGYSTYDPIDDTSATQPVYIAVLLDGYAPGGAYRRRVIIRRVLSVAGVETAYKKEDQTFIPVTLAGHYVSSAIKPFRVIDQTT
jgi:hypothetical protein